MTHATLTAGQIVTVCTRGYLGQGTVVRRRRNGWWVVACIDGKERQVSGASCRPVEHSPTRAPRLTRSPTYERPESKPSPKDSPVRSRRYLDWIRRQPCAACGASPPSEASHHPEPGHGSMGAKTHDTRTIPLCSKCHRDHHAGRNAMTLDRLWVERQITRCLTRYVWPSGTR